MAYWIDPNTTKSSKKSYTCDALADIQNLPRFGIYGTPQDNDSISDNPCGYGSICLCIENSSVWVLSKNTNTWKEI